MPKLSKITESSSATEVVNALRTSSDNRIKLTGGKEGQVWSITGTSYKGSIPMSSHNAKNLEVAIKELIKARDAVHLAD